MNSDLGRSIRYAGAIIAFLIGSGFASGQEIMQFFGAYGPVYSGIALLLTLVLIAWCASTVLQDSRRLKLNDANQIFRYYCGNALGMVLEWLSPLFLFGIYVVMLSGAGSLLYEYYGLPAVFGRTVMFAMSLATVLLGLEKLTNILGFIGPVIIVCSICIGLLCMLKNFGGIRVSAELVSTLPVTKATSNWWLSGITYATFCGMTLIPYLSGIGKGMKNDRMCRRSGFMGGIAFSMAAAALNYGILSNLTLLYDKAVPSVFMADMLIPGAGVAFSLVMIAGIYTTAVPMLWTACNKLAPDDHSPRFRICAVILAVIAYVGGKLPFSLLVNTLYPYMGYVGLVVFAGILFRRFRPDQSKFA